MLEALYAHLQELPETFLLLRQEVRNHRVEEKISLLSVDESVHHELLTLPEGVNHLNFQSSRKVQLE